LGADVIKVEEPTRGDQGRGASTDTPGVDSHYFMLLNANKRSVTLNLKEERGREMLRELIRQGDVFVENFGPGVIERLGFGWEEVRALNPRMVFAQIKGFAPDSPYGNFLAFDMIAQAVGGSVATSGEKCGRPIRPGPTIADTGSGMHAVIGILAALHQRTTTGRGQRVEVAMQEVVINFSRISYASLGLWGKHPARNGNQSVLSATSPSEVYPCKGGGENDYCFIYTSRAANHQWKALLQVIGHPELLDDPRFATPQQRFAHATEVDEMIKAWTLRHDKRTAMELLGAAGVPAGAVLEST
jgi:formyl-CoA transferase